jgi:hypothetical protein
MKNPYYHVTERYPTASLPKELLGDVAPGSHVRVIVQQLDENGDVVDGHPYLDRDRRVPATVEEVTDYVRWLRGNP